jgi:hypothetical protein
MNTITDELNDLIPLPDGALFPHGGGPCAPMSGWSVETVRAYGRAVLALAEQKQAARIAELEAAQPAQVAAPDGWQPIETAPADMTEPVVVRWINEDGNEMREFDYTEDGCWMQWHDHVDHARMVGGHGVREKPPYQHWMPLPAAPKREGGV